MGLSSSEDPMIVAGVVLAWYRTVTDGQTVGRSDGGTESIIAKTALCVAGYADALSKIFPITGIEQWQHDQLWRLPLWNRTEYINFSERDLINDDSSFCSHILLAIDMQHHVFPFENILLFFVCDGVTGIQYINMMVYNLEQSSTMRHVCITLQVQLCKLWWISFKSWSLVETVKWISTGCLRLLQLLHSIVCVMPGFINSE